MVAPTGNYDDAIRLTPSVIDVSPNGPGLGEAQILSIRGFQDGQFNVTFDGIPFADSDDFTHHSSAYFVMRDLGSVEVDRGPGDATTIGDATFGGTVAMRSIDPSGTGPVSASASGGSFGTVSGGMLLDTIPEALAGGGSAVIDAESAQSDGALDGASQRRSTLFGKLVVPLDAGLTLTALSNVSRTVQNDSPGATRAEIAAGGPSVALDRHPGSQSFEGYNNSVYDTDLSYAELSRPMDAGFAFSDTVYSYGLDRHFGQGLDPGGETPNGTAFGAHDVPGQNGRNGLRAWGDILRAEIELPAGAALRAGFWVERQANARSLLETDESRGDAPDPVLVPVVGIAGSASIDREQAETLVTVQPYLQVDWQATSWLRLSTGLKAAWFERNVAAPVMEGTRLPSSFSAVAASLLPDLTARLRLRPGWDAYVQAAQGFLAPTLQEFDVTDPGRAEVAAADDLEFPGRHRMALARRRARRRPVRDPVPECGRGAHDRRRKPRFQRGQRDLSRHRGGGHPTAPSRFQPVWQRFGQPGASIRGRDGPERTGAGHAAGDDLGRPAVQPGPAQRVAHRSLGRRLLWGCRPRAVDRAV